MKQHARGISLIEALVACLILASGLLAMVALHAQLRAHAELARQRAEALRLAQQDIEALRAFAVRDAAQGGASFEAIAGAGPTALPDLLSNTAYGLTRLVTDLGDRKLLRVQLDWTDRHGSAQRLELPTLIAAADPALSAALALALPPEPLRPAFDRHPSIPTEAQDLGDGRSVLKPLPDATVAWVFDHRTGLVSSRCEVDAATPTSALRAASLTRCTVGTAYPVSGYVRFSDVVPATALEARHPSGTARPLHMGVQRSDTGWPSPGHECFDDAPAEPAPGRSAVRFRCIVLPGGDGGWSGTLRVQPVGWGWGPTVADARLCRYSADLDGNGRIDADEHPAQYAGIRTPLTQQNFLVVRGDSPCPVDDARGAVPNVSTVQQQPAG